MSLYLIFSIITVLLSFAFALLHLLVSFSELKKGKKTFGIYLLFLGSALATFSLFLYFFFSIVALSLWMIGCGVICYGAYWNGKHKENFNPAHHVIRIGIALILTILLTLI